MADKILCPFCGAEMLFDKMTYFREGERMWEAYSCCANGDCGAEGPKVEGMQSGEKAMEAARAAALRRYTPLLKPMTFGEILGKEAELEIRDNCKTKRVIVPYHLDETIEVLWEDSFLTGEDRRYLSKSLYGKTWRCWERTPTDEERRSAEWET